MLLRVRSNVGVWRIDGLSEATATVQDILDGIAVSRPNVVYEKPLSTDPACSNQLDTIQTLAEQGLRHGAMVHCRVDAASTVDISVPAVLGEDTMTDAETATANQQNQPVPNMRRIIDKDGSIKLIPSTEVRDAGQDRGFRRGMMPLRDMKMQVRH